MKKKFYQVKIKLGPRSYEAHVGEGIINKLDSLLTKKLKELNFLSSGQPKRAFIVSDEALSEAREKTIQSLKQKDWEVHEFAFKAGESFKDFSAIYPIYGSLLSAKANRDSVLIALGGGSISDAAGFIASTYLRGIPWVGLPTTLLSQVDSCIGGKTGVNHGQGKNLIGTFYQPCLVLCEIGFLKTLSQREMISGLGEMLKYGFIFDRKLFYFLKDSWKKTLEFDSKILADLVQKSLSWKALVVAKDEYDKKGVRESLNFGHTFGHALETQTNYEAFQHGEAVIWGMRFALCLSWIRKKISNQDFWQGRELLWQIPVPALPASKNLSVYFKHMGQDKKIRQGRLHFVLINKIGKYISDSRVTDAQLEKAYQLMQEKI